MNDDELRALVRESIARHLGSQMPAPSPPFAGRQGDVQLLASHAVYALTRADEDGPCVIEPSVPCNHCNYCKSHGY